MTDNKDDFETPPSACVECGYRVDHAAAFFEKPQQPTPGDLSVCLNCAAVSVFEKDLTWRKPTRSEELEFPLEVARYQLEIRRRSWFKTLHPRRSPRRA